MPYNGYEPGFFLKSIFLMKQKFLTEKKSKDLADVFMKTQALRVKKRSLRHFDL